MSPPLVTVAQLQRVLWPNLPADEPTIFTDETLADLADAVQIGTTEVIRFCGRDFTEINPTADPVPATTTWYFDAGVGPWLMIPDAAQLVTVRAYGTVLVAGTDYQPVRPGTPAGATIQRLRRIAAATRAALPWTVGHPVGGDDPRGQIEVTAFAGWPVGTVPGEVRQAALIVAARWWELREAKFQDMAGNDSLGTRRPPNGLLPGPVQQFLTPWIRIEFAPVVES